MQMLSIQEVKLDSLPLNWVGLSVSLPLRRVWRGKIVTLLLKKKKSTGRHNLNQKIKDKIAIHKSCHYHVPQVWHERCHDTMRSACHLCVISPLKPTTPNSSWKKHQTNPKWEKFYVISDQYSLKWSRSWKQEQAEKLFRSEKAKK